MVPCEYKVLEKLLQIKLVPLFYTEDPDRAETVVEGCVRGGASVIEFTCRGRDALVTFAQLCRMARTRWGDLLLGLGTVTDAPTAVLGIDAGAAFIVSPYFETTVAQVCKSRGVLYIPGCATPKEIAYAAAEGHRLIKLFPAGALGGPPYLRALRDVFSHVLFMPTGGIRPTLDELRAWFAAGAACVGIGSALLSPDLVRAGSVEAIQAAVQAAFQAVREALGETAAA